MKKYLSLFLVVMFLSVNAGFAGTVSSANEHLLQSKKVMKKTPTNLVISTPEQKTILQYNVIEVTFASDFSTKTAHVGDDVTFLLNDGLQTVEGTQLLPAGTSLVAEIINIELPKSFNRSGKVYLQFKCFVTPDGTAIPLKAKLFGNKEFLSRGKLSAFAKGLTSTLVGVGAGIGAGCGIGAAAGAVVVGGFAIGLPVGLAVGGTIGYVTPGLHYKAKAGDKLLIQFIDNFELCCD